MQNAGRQPSFLKDQGKAIRPFGCMLQLILEREVASRYQEGTATVSSEHTSRRDIQHIQEQTVSKDRNAGSKPTSTSTAVGVSKKEINPLEHWRKNFRWPEEYFKSEGNMDHLLARKKSPSSLRAKQLEADSTPSSATPSDQMQREAKSNPYTHPSYETVLAIRGSFMVKSDLGITNASKRLCQILLEAEQSVPRDSLFCDDLFDETLKCGAATLNIADRQNAHSMTLAVRGVTDLFRRENELHQEILAFSISHDHRTVRIYGHYPIIKGKETAFYRHPIRTFDFTELDGKEKWTAYKFTNNVYDIWMPTHLKKNMLSYR
ncbi:hypothetical protein RJZ90_002013 [Blastomyces dermatitidis]